MAIRIKLRLGTTVPNDEYLDVGEGLWDPENNRLGFGSGNAQPLWYPSLDPINQDIELFDNSGMRSQRGGKSARLAWDAENQLSIYTRAGLRIRLGNDYVNFYARANFNAGGSLSGDFDTAGGRFTDMNIQTITLPTSTDRVLIKSLETGRTVGRIDEQGVTGLSLQRLFLAIASMQETTVALFRNLYSSGLVALHSNFEAAAFNPQSKNAETSYSALSIHNHPDFLGVAGLGELSVLANGYHLQTRHNDYRLSRPVKDVTTFAKRAINNGVPVPTSVRNLPLGYTGLAFNGNQSGTQVEWMRNVYLQNPELCVVELSYLEVWIQKFDDKFLDTATSTRLYTSESEYKKIVEFVKWYTTSGYNNPHENLPIPSGIVVGHDEFGHPHLGYINWRVSSIPVATLSNRASSITLDGVNYNLKALPYNRTKAIAGIIDASNRFKLRRNLHSRFFVSANQENKLDETQKRSWASIIDSADALFDCPDLEELCRLAPGFNGIGNDDAQSEIDYNGARVRGNRNQLVRYSAYDSIMGVNYYNNKYLMNTLNASGQTSGVKGFNDLNLFTAKASWPQILGGYTFMIPLELIVRTPRETWNPFNVAYQSTVTGDGSANRPYSGYNEFGSFFTMPADAMYGPNIDDSMLGRTEADTVFTAYVQTPAGTKLMRASGIRTFDFLSERRRFPVMPIATAYASEAGKFSLFMETLKPLLKRVASGNVTGDEIDDAF